MSNFTFFGTDGGCPPGYTIPTENECQLIANEINLPFYRFSTYNFTGCARVSVGDVLGLQDDVSRVVFVPTSLSIGETQNIGCSSQTEECFCILATNPSPPPGPPLPYSPPSPPPFPPFYPEATHPPALPDSSPPPHISPSASPPAPYFPSPEPESRCNGNYNSRRDCGVGLYVDKCPAVQCPQLLSEGIFPPAQDCLFISKLFHMIFLQYECYDTYHGGPLTSDCIVLKDGYGMGAFLHSYSSKVGMVLSTVLKKRSEPRLPFTTSPPTFPFGKHFSDAAETCERLIPVRRGRTFKILYTQSTRVFNMPDDYYVIQEFFPPPKNPPLPPSPAEPSPPPPMNIEYRDTPVYPDDLLDYSGQRRHQSTFAVSFRNYTEEESTSVERRLSESNVECSTCSHITFSDYNYPLEFLDAACAASSENGDVKCQYDAGGGMYFGCF